MIDLILGFGLAMLVVRGWFRGFVREAMDLVGLIVGVIAAFRLSPALGPVLRDMAGLSDEVARFAAGVAIFFAVGAGAAVALPRQLPEPKLCRRHRGGRDRRRRPADSGRSTSRNPTPRAPPRRWRKSRSTT